jgi:LysM repeat protein
MGFLDSVKNVLRGGAAAPAPEAPPEERKAPEAEQAPEVEQAPVAEPEPTYTTYTVRTGDTLRDIGARHGIARDELARLNDIDEPDLIRPGQQLRIPTDRDTDRGTD